MEGWYWLDWWWTLFWLKKCYFLSTHLRKRFQVWSWNDWCLDQYRGQTFTMVWASAWQNQQLNLCTQQRLWSAWASTKTDQMGLHCLHEKAWVISYPLRALTLIKLGRCPSWSESLLGAHTKLLVLSCSSSFIGPCGYWVVFDKCSVAACQLTAILLHW